MCEICEMYQNNCQWSCFGVFIANFEQTEKIVLVFLLLTLNKEMSAGSFISLQISVELNVNFV